MSFELGIPEEELASRLTNRSFMRYQHHAARWMLPSRRLQLQLAQTALWSALAAGAKDLSLEDFIFDPVDEIEPEQQVEVAAEFFGFKPRPKRGAEPSPETEPGPASS